MKDNFFKKALALLMVLVIAVSLLPVNISYAVDGVAYSWDDDSASGTIGEYILYAGLTGFNSVHKIEIGGSMIPVYCVEPANLSPGNVNYNYYALDSLLQSGRGYNDDVLNGLCSIMELGYPATTMVNGVSLTAEQAQVATQFAIRLWLAYKGVSSVQSSFTEVNLSAGSGAGAAKTLAAAKWMFNEAKNGNRTGLASLSVTLSAETPTSAHAGYYLITATFTGLGTTGTYMLNDVKVGNSSILSSVVYDSATTGSWNGSTRQITADSTGKAVVKFKVPSSYKDTNVTFYASAMPATGSVAPDNLKFMLPTSEYGSKNYQMLFYLTSDSKPVNVNKLVRLESFNAYGSVELVKKDSINASILTGFTFELQEWSQSADAYVTSTQYGIKERTADPGHYASYKLSTGIFSEIPRTDDNQGKIRVREIATPDEKLYSPKDASGNYYYWDVVIGDYESASPQTLPINAKNTISKGKLKIEKSLSEASTKNETYWFHVTGGPTGHTQNFWTSISIMAGQKSGTVTSGDIPVGSYTVTEVTGNNSTTAVTMTNEFPYVATPVTSNVTVTSGQTVTDAKSNVLATGALKLTKTISAPASADRTFWFRVNGGAPGHTRDQWTSITVKAGQTTGEVTVTGLSIGTYTVTEVTGNNSTTAVTTTNDFPFAASPVTSNVTVNYNQTTTNAVTNTLQTGALQINKNISEASTANETFWFRVTGGPAGYKRDLWTSITIVAGQKSSTVTVSGLPIGEYTVTEVTGNNSTTAVTPSAAFPYVASPITSNITVKQGQTVIDAKTNTLQVGAVRIGKSIDETSSKDETFWFWLTGGPSGHKRDVWQSVTIPKGSLSAEVTVSNLPIGSYTVMEVSGNGSKTAPMSSSTFPYSAKNGTQNVTVTAGQTTDLKEINQLLKGSLKITKNVSEAPTEDRTYWFSITGGPDGHSVSIWRNIQVKAGEKTAEITVTGLPIGTYTIREVAAENSTAAPTSGAAFPYTVTPSENIAIIKANQTEAVTFMNTEMPSALEIRKNLAKEPGLEQTFWFHVTGPNGYDSYVSIAVGANTTKASTKISNLKKGSYTITEVLGDGDPTPVPAKDAMPWIVTSENPVSVTLIPATTQSAEFTNAETGGLTVIKRLDAAMKTDRTFWLKIEGPAGFTTRWERFTIPAGSLQASKTILNIPTGIYTVKEVTGDGSDTEVSPSSAFPFDVSGAGSVTVIRGQTSTKTLTNTQRRGQLQIVKSISAAMNEDRTFWFMVVGPEQYKSWTSIELKSGETSAKSSIITDLLIGEYTIIEVTENKSETPVSTTDAFPFEAVPSSVTVEVIYDNMVSATVTNNIATGSLKITKNLSKPVDADATFWFLLEGPAESKSTKRWIDLTVKAGEQTASRTVDGLIIGSYTLKEVEAKDSEKPVTLTKAFPYVAYGDGNVVITKGMTTTAKWTNEYRLGKIQIEKVDNLGDKLEGVEFTVYGDSALTGELFKLVTDGEGKAESNDIVIPAAGRKVYVQETKTDDKHVLNRQVYEVTLVPNESVLVSGKAIVNQLITGKIGLTKTGETFIGYEETNTEFGVLHTPKYASAGLKGAKFLIFRADDVTVNGTDVKYDKAKAVATLESTENEVLSGELPLGKYVVVEDEAPAGYVKVPYVGTVELTKKDEVTTIVVEHLTHKNEQASTQIGIYKEAEVLVTTTSGERVTTTVQLQPGAGFVFGVFAAEDFAGAEGTIKTGDMVLLGSTNADGRIEFTTKVPLGKYVIRELSAKEGYEENTEEYPITLSAAVGETLIKVEALPDSDPIINTLSKTKVKISKKTLAGDEPLPGTRIQIFDENGLLLFDQLTEADGTIPEFYALCGRTYTFREQYAPSGYAILTEMLTFTVNKDGTISGTTEIKDDVTRIRFLKVDEGDKPVQGAEFTLYDEEELPVQVVLSDENGIVEFAEVAYGKYKVAETKPAEGMKLADFVEEINVDGTWENGEPIKVVNHPDNKTGHQAAPITIILISMFILLVLCAVIYMNKRNEMKVAASLEDAWNNKDERK